MSKRTRWIIFIIAVGVFVAASFFLVMYALGYPYDVATRAFVRVGSLRVVANVGADVLINGKPSGNLSFLSNEFSKGRLLPRTYHVALVRDGMRPWKKDVEVKAGFFADFPKIVLLPSILQPESVATASWGFSIHDSNIRPTKAKNLNFTAHEIYVEWLEDTDYQPFHRKGDILKVWENSGTIEDVQWYRDREHLLISSDGKLIFTELDSRGGANQYILTDLSGPFWYDEDRNGVFISSPTGVLFVPF